MRHLWGHESGKWVYDIHFRSGPASADGSMASHLDVVIMGGGRNNAGVPGPGI